MEDLTQTETEVVEPGATELVATDAATDENTHEARLFQIPGNFGFSDIDERVAELARRDFQNRKSLVRPTLPVHQLRETLIELAPVVRAEMELSEFTSTDVHGLDGELVAENAQRVMITPLVAHFAHVALAWIEAEGIETTD